MKTSQFLFVLLMSLVCSWVNAQDTILKTDQTEIAAKVTEITTDEVKFKYFNRLDGPTYSLRKSEVFVIIYKDGTREKFNEAVAKPAATPVSAYVEKPAIRPDPSAYTTPTAPESDKSAIKRTGWMWNVGYTTPSSAIAKANGITYGSGYYFLGPGRMGGIMLDVDVMNYFGQSAPNYGILAANALFRFSKTSSFYVGSGLGYATVSVKLKDQYGLEKTFSSGDIGGKAFLGAGVFRMAIVWPSLGSTSGGGLLTVGICTNPFK